MALAKIAILLLLLLTHSEAIPLNRQLGGPRFTKARAMLVSVVRKRAEAVKRHVHKQGDAGIHVGSPPSSHGIRVGSRIHIPISISPPGIHAPNSINVAGFHARIHVQTSISRWLDAHNHFRARYGAPALRWEQHLVAASKRLTDTCHWEHTQNNPYGENMSAGQHSIKEVVDGWVTGPEEKGSYSPSDPQPSHFTQVVWHKTTAVGCYMTVCRQVKNSGLPGYQSPVQFWGCNYEPAGNVIGDFQKNVKAAPQL